MKMPDPPNETVPLDGQAEVVEDAASGTAPTQDYAGREATTGPLSSMTTEQIDQQIELYLNRLFVPGELLPWKGVTFRVIGIRGGVLGLQVQKFNRKAPNPRKGNAHTKWGKYQARKNKKGK